MTAGKELREAREKKELSLHEVSDELHIRMTYLQAIENGRAEILPSVVQGRGFVRMYAEYLGLDAGDVLRSWDNPQALDSVSERIPNIEPIERTQPRPTAKAVKPAVFQSMTIPAPEKTASPVVASGVSFPPISGWGVSQPEKTEEDPIRDIFRDIGGQLKQRREKLCLTLEDCESQTLIRANYIGSMENGDFDQLPSFIQGRGMLNNYAVFLNLDVDTIMLRFSDALQLLSQDKARNALEASARNVEKRAKPVKRPNKLRQFLTPDLFVGVVVIFGMAAVIIYSAVKISAYRSLQPTALPDLNAAFMQQFEQSTGQPAYLPTSTATVDPNTLLQNSLANLAGQEAAGEGEAAQPVQVILSANQRTYLSVTADGKEVFSGRTLPNSSYPFDAQNLIEVTTGNASAISVVYNQTNLGLLGSIGQVISIEFSSQMAATPTPRFSPTPTSTFEPTYTPQPETPLPTLTVTPYIP